IGYVPSLRVKKFELAVLMMMGGGMARLSNSRDTPLRGGWDNYEL
ncbi:7108_t:CDS:2, partial [Scutellospora calospora]